MKTAIYLRLVGFLVFFLVISVPISAQSMTVEKLVNGLKAEVRVLAQNGAAREEYEDFRERHNLKKLDYWTYLKNKVAFECTRDAGLWHILWRITDEQPNSTKIWAQWKRHRGSLLPQTAVAECDEISALYAVIARQLGVQHIGLFWPTSNHTVAVWTVEGKRIVVPTTTIFLKRYDGFDAQGFDPKTQATIYDYTASDVSMQTRIPESLGRFFLSQVRNYGGASQDLLHELRYMREAAWQGRSVKTDIRQLRQQFRNQVDKRALDTFAQQYLKQR